MGRVSAKTYTNVLVVETITSHFCGASVVELDSVGLDMCNTRRSGVNGLDLTAITKGFLDQCNDEAGGEMSILGVEQDLNLDLAFIVADSVERSTHAVVASDVEAENLWGHIADLPATTTSVLVSSNSITNIKELNEEEVMTDVSAKTNGRARWILLCLV